VEGKFLNVKQELANRGLGIEWNPFPLRPFANQVLPSPDFEYAVKELKTEEDGRELETVFKTVMEREQSRLDRYVERLKCRYGIDMDDVVNVMH
jgi:hypothetical protein